MNTTFLSRTTSTLILAASALLSSPLAAAPPNLLVNGDFNGGLSGWSRSEAVSWSPSGGGVIRVTQPDEPRGADVLLQCVPVEAGRLYDLGASAYLPDGDGSGGLSVRIRWHEAAGCLGRPLRGSGALDFSAASPAAWQRKELRLAPAPAGAASAMVLVVVRADAPDAYVLYADDLTLTRSTEVETLTVPTAASVTGALGQRFQTDLVLHNPEPVHRMVALKLYPAGWPHGHVTPVVLRIGPNETRTLPDVMREVFGAVDRAGAIELDYDPVEGPLLAAARAVTVHPENPGNGMGIPVLGSGAARAAATFLGLPGEGSRVNAGAFNPATSPVEVTFRVRDAAGQLLGSVTRTWGAQEWFQINDLPGAAGVGSGAAAVELLAARPVLPFVIAIDNRSGDPTYLQESPTR